MFGLVDESLLAAARPTLATVGLFFICMAIWPKPVTTGRPFMIAVSLAFMARYAWWRMTETLPAPALTFEYALALTFLVAEIARDCDRSAVVAVSYSHARSVPRGGCKRRMAPLAA